MSIIETVIYQLNKKKVPFMIKQDPSGKTPDQIVPIHLTKPDRFFRANGKVIPKNLASFLIRLKVVRI